MQKPRTAYTTTTNRPTGHAYTAHLQSVEHGFRSPVPGQQVRLARKQCVRLFFLLSIAARPLRNYTSRASSMVLLWRELWSDL